MRSSCAQTSCAQSDRPTDTLSFAISTVFRSRMGPETISKTTRIRQSYRGSPRKAIKSAEFRLTGSIHRRDVVIVGDQAACGGSGLSSLLGNFGVGARSARGRAAAVDQNHRPDNADAARADV